MDRARPLRPDYDTSSGVLLEQPASNLRQRKIQRQASQGETRSGGGS